MERIQLFTSVVKTILCVRSSHDMLDLYAEIQIIFGTVCTLVFLFCTADLSAFYDI